MLWRKVEISIFDRSIDAVGIVLIWCSKTLKILQNGNLSSYLRLMLFGVLILLFGTLVLVFGGR